MDNVLSLAQEFGSDAYTFVRPRPGVCTSNRHDWRLTRMHCRCGTCRRAVVRQARHPHLYPNRGWSPKGLYDCRGSPVGRACNVDDRCQARTISGILRGHGGVQLAGSVSVGRREADAVLWHEHP